MNPLLSTMGLRGRIVATFGVAGCIAFVVLAVSWWTSSRSLERFREYSTLGQRARFEVRIAHAVAEQQRYAQAYTAFGHDSAAKEVRLRYARLARDVAERQRGASAETGDELRRIEKHLATYISTFERLQEQRGRRRELASALEAAGRGAEAALLELEREVGGGADVGLTVRDLLRAQRSAQRYFEGLDSKDVGEAKRALERVVARLLRVPSSRTRAEAEAAIDAYERVFLEAVQRTRGYLVLVNVVMAAEVHEIVYAARRLQEISDAQMAAQAAAVARDLDRMATALWVLMALALVFLAVMSAQLYRSITEPIERLSSTFRDLAQGRRDLVLMEYEIDDEIGELTSAAAVFRDKNVETERLLGQAQALTVDLESKQAQLQRSNEELEQFVYTVSHDLKSPLVTSMGFIEIAKRLAARGDIDAAPRSSTASSGPTSAWAA